MRLFTLGFGCVLALAGCSKQTSGGGSTPTASGTGGAGSSTMATGHGSGSAASLSADASTQVPAPHQSPAAQALDGFDRAFAPLWKLDKVARVRETCTRVGLLRREATALVGVPAPNSAADDWKDGSQQLVALVDQVTRSCRDVPKSAFNAAALTEETSIVNSAIGDLHGAFSSLFALVPNAKPIDAHAGDPLPATDAAHPVNLDHLRAALDVLESAANKLAKHAHGATSRADACKGSDQLDPLFQALSADDVVAGPPKAESWTSELQTLSAELQSVSMACGPDSKATADAVASRLDTVRAQISKMLDAAK